MPNTHCYNNVLTLHSGLKMEKIVQKMCVSVVAQFPKKLKAIFFEICNRPNPFEKFSKKC